MEERLQKKTNDINRFNNSVDNIIAMKVYFKDEKEISEKNIKITKEQYYNHLMHLLLLLQHLIRLHYLLQELV